MTDQRVLSRTARQAMVRQLLENHEVGSQAELSDLLAGQGVHVTQGTLSKDLVELGAVRSRSASGAVSYIITAEESSSSQAMAATRLARLCVEMLVDAEASANLVVARTPPGAAQYFASAIDRAGWQDVLGTIAGDDTVLLISRDAAGGEQLASRLRDLAAGRGAEPRDQEHQ